MRKFRPDHIENWICAQHQGSWYTWTDSKNKVYANLRLPDKVGIDGNLVDNPYSLPTEQECADGLSALQTTWDDGTAEKTADKTSGTNKLKALGLTDDEITAITGN